MVQGQRFLLGGVSSAISSISSWQHLWQQLVVALWSCPEHPSRKQWFVLYWVGRTWWGSCTLPTKGLLSPVCTMTRWEATETHSSYAAALPWQPVKIRASSGKMRDFKFCCSQELLLVSDCSTSTSLFQSFSSIKTNCNGYFCNAQVKVLATLYCWFKKNKWD